MDDDLLDGDRPRLIQHITILDYVAHDATHALFCSQIDGERQPTKLLLRMETYEEMEKPEVLSIAVRPGNCFTDADVAFQTPPRE